MRNGMGVTTQIMESNAVMRNRLAAVLDELTKRADQAMGDQLANSERGIYDHWSEGRYDGLREAIDLISQVA